ncbi:MAG: hypothetical protein ABGY10_02030 [bacterium]
MTYFLNTAVDDLFGTFPPSVFSLLRNRRHGAAVPVVLGAEDGMSPEKAVLGLLPILGVPSGGVVNPDVGNAFPVDHAVIPLLEHVQVGANEALEGLVQSLVVLVPTDLVEVLRSQGRMHEGQVAPPNSTSKRSMFGKDDNANRSMDDWFSPSPYPSRRARLLCAHGDQTFDFVFTPWSSVA